MSGLLYNRPLRFATFLLAMFTLSKVNMYLFLYLHKTFSK